MKKLLLLLLPLAVVAVFTSLAAKPQITVSASTALRVGWLQSKENSRSELSIADAFQPRFHAAVAGIYGEDTEVKYIEQSLAVAARELENGSVDAVLVFDRRLPRRLARAGGHVLKAESISRPGKFVAYLVTQGEQPSLESLLANAFSYSLNTPEVRMALQDPIMTEEALVAGQRETGAN